MIEDDLRGLLEDELGINVYSRVIPAKMPECVVVQKIGGHSSFAGIRRQYVLISIMGVSADRETASQMMRRARDALITSLPFTIEDDGAIRHYYTAKAQADGSLEHKTVNGPKYVEFVDMEVKVSI